MTSNLFAEQVRTVLDEACACTAAEASLYRQGTPFVDLAMSNLSPMELLRLCLYTKVGGEHHWRPASSHRDHVIKQLIDLLVAKNTAYGNSVLDPIRVYSKANRVEQLRVRIDDKLSRMCRGTITDVVEVQEDTLTDLSGYAVLLVIASNQPKLVEHKLIFQRSEDAEAAHVAVCTFKAKPTDAPLDLLKAALSAWSKTEDGWEALNDTREKFNIGDAAVYVGWNTLAPFGVHQFRVVLHSCETPRVDFDTVLMHNGDE